MVATDDIRWQLLDVKTASNEEDFTLFCTDINSVIMEKSFICLND